VVAHHNLLANLLTKYLLDTDCCAIRIVWQPGAHRDSME
jgi:hypothetical protein